MPATLNWDPLAPDAPAAAASLWSLLAPVALLTGLGVLLVWRPLQQWCRQHVLADRPRWRPIPAARIAPDPRFADR